MIADVARTLMQKLNAATPRERAAMAVLGAIAAITAVVYAIDWAGQRGTAAASATQAASETASLQSTFEDEGYRRVLASESGTMWRLSRTADAFAAEEVVTELEALCTQAGFGEPRVALVDQTQMRGRVGVLEASISADFSWAAFLALLQLFEASELSFSVRSIDVSEGDGQQRMTLVVGVPVIEGADTP
jgi:hypothetical protein